MPRINYTAVAEALGVEGKFWWLAPSYNAQAVPVADFKEMGIPTGTAGTERRPTWVTHEVLGRTRAYVFGSLTANCLIDERMRLMRMGIPAPDVKPTVTATTGPGPTGTAICYLRFRDSIGGRVGPLSVASASFSLANQSRAWSSLPTTCLDPSVDEIQGLVSMDGATPRVAWTRQLGVSSVTEAVATLALGEAAPDSFTAMPYGTFGVAYNERLILSGNRANPHEVYLSALGEFERYEGFNLTTDGDECVGLAVGPNGVLLYGSRERIYRARGFSEDDFERDIERPDMGFVGHHGIAMVNGRLIIPTSTSVYLYNGQWVDLMPDTQHDWRDQYRTYQEDFEAAQGFYDPVDNTYRFGPVRHTRVRNANGGDVWVDWVLNAEGLQPDASGGFKAAWSLDAQQRKPTTATTWRLPGNNQPELVRGNEDGYLRRQDVEDDVDDDSDSLAKRHVIEPPTIQPDTGGDDYDGFVFHKSWLYVRSETCAWGVEFRVGTGENARNRLDADWSDTNAAGEQAAAGLTAEPRNKYLCVLEGCGGEALNMAVIVDSPTKEFRFRGWGGTYGPGIASRGVIASDTDDESIVGPGQGAMSAAEGGGAVPSRSECGLAQVDERAGSGLPGVFWTVYGGAP